MDEIRGKSACPSKAELVRSMTVGENVALPLREHTTLEDSTIEIILRLKLQQVGLEGFEYYTPAQLSGGMKKRAAVARALAMDPEICFSTSPRLDWIPSSRQVSTIDSGTQARVPHDHHCGHARAGERVLDRRPHALDRQRQHRGARTTEEMRSSTQPRVRQFLDRIAEPEVSGELDYLQM